MQPLLPHPLTETSSKQAPGAAAGRTNHLDYRHNGNLRPRNSRHCTKTGAARPEPSQGRNECPICMVGCMRASHVISDQAGHGFWRSIRIAIVKRQRPADGCPLRLPRRLAPETQFASTEPIVGPIANLAGVYSKQSSNAQLGATNRGVVESPSLGLEFEHHENIEKARLTGAPCFVVDPSGSVGFDAPPPT